MTTLHSVTLDVPTSFVHVRFIILIFFHLSCFFLLYERNFTLVITEIYTLLKIDLRIKLRTSCKSLINVFFV